MKRTLALLLLCCLSGLSQADNPIAPPSSTQAIAPQMVLAMDRILPGATEDKVKALLAEEARAVLNLYLTGQVRQWYFRQDRPGVVFMLEADSMERAQAMVDALPLSKAGLLAYDLIPIGPYIPLATLLNPPAPAKSGKKKAN